MPQEKIPLPEGAREMSAAEVAAEIEKVAYTEEVNARQVPFSGVMVYRVGLAKAPLPFVDVEAATGDEAARKAQEQVPGAFVASVNPAPQKRAA